MPKRKIPRTAAPAITPKVAELYVKVVELHNKHHTCFNETACPTRFASGGRCTDCDEFFELQVRLDNLLNLKPWQPGPLDLPDDDPLIVALEAAASELEAADERD